MNDVTGFLGGSLQVEDSSCDSGRGRVGGRLLHAVVGSHTDVFELPLLPKCFCIK